MTPFPTTLREGRYTLGAMLGEGGMAMVYAAHDRDLGVDRAVKVLLPHGAREALRRRLRNEAKAMARLSHPHILGIHDVGTEGEFDFIVMDLARGGSLQQRVAEQGPLPLGAALGVMVQVLSALAAAHASGIIHRDVKPHNILLDDNQMPLLADFGIAMLAEADRSTRTGVAMGSLAFMPPEQRLDAAHVGPTADIYACGCTLFALLTNDNPVDLFLAGPDSERWDGVPMPVRAVVQKAAAPHSTDRYATAGEMANALLKVLDELGPQERDKALNSRGFFPAPSEALVTGRSQAQAPTAAMIGPPQSATGLTLAVPQTVIRPGNTEPPSALRVVGLAAIAGATLAAMLALAVWWFGTNPVPTNVVPPAQTPAEVAPEPSPEPQRVEPHSPEPPPEPVATPVPAPVPAPAPAPSPVAQPPEPKPAAMPTGPTTPVHGDWTGSRNGMNITLGLSGPSDALRGAVTVSWQGKTDVSEVRGAFNESSLALVLHDTSEGLDAGSYELTLADQRLQGFFIRAAGGRVPLSLKRP